MESFSVQREKMNINVSREIYESLLQMDFSWDRGLKWESGREASRRGRSGNYCLVILEELARWSTKWFHRSGKGPAEVWPVISALDLVLLRGWSKIRGKKGRSHPDWDWPGGHDGYGSGEPGPAERWRWGLPRGCCVARESSVPSGASCPSERLIKNC